VEKNIRQLAATRDASTWNAIKSNPSFKGLSSFQVTQLEAILTPYDAPEGTVLFREGDLADHVFILIDGCVEACRKGQCVKICEKGDILGDIFAIKDNKTIDITYTALKDSKLYRIDGRKVLQFLKDNPGVYMNLMFEKGYVK
jgi:CRP-like cAMP-binding protein